MTAVPLKHMVKKILLIKNFKFELAKQISRIVMKNDLKSIKRNILYCAYKER